MSFFVGHSLAALTVFSFDQRLVGSRYYRLAWLMWLVVIASAPDADYVVRSLGAPAHQGLRVTHSIVFGLLLPLSTVAVLACLRLEKNAFRVLSVQAVVAGLSHLMLDLLVGVTPLPLLYPVSSMTFRLPFGLLPSAGRVQLSNPYFYRNLLIEMGILIPLFYGILEACRGRIGINKERLKLVLLTAVITFFLVWSISLSR